jgi:serine/threonine protein kinase
MPDTDAAAKAARIVAFEEDEQLEEDVIPGPPQKQKAKKTRVASGLKSVLDISSSGHIKGDGILASRADLELPPEEFAAGCILLQQAARGDQEAMEAILKVWPNHANFRDYDRRTALHVAASEGHLHICEYLVDVQQVSINRSDRWGGSPLDDAHRHRHLDIVKFLRKRGAKSGSTKLSTNLILAAAEGDVDEVQMLLCYTASYPKRSSLDMSASSATHPRRVALDLSASSNTQTSQLSASQMLDLNEGDYDSRTALHLAAGEGHAEIVRLLCEAGANPNAEDRWGGRPLNDALRSHQTDCARILEQFGAKRSKTESSLEFDKQRQDFQLDDSYTDRRREHDNLKIDFEELEMIDRIGAGAFGEIYKCRWRGTLVAAKCIKTAKIRQEWLVKHAMTEGIKKGDVDDAIRMVDEAEGMKIDQSEKDAAIADFRQEISVLKSLRHPNIVLLLAYSTTQDYEVMISELMKCSLLDVFKAHLVQGTRLTHRQQIIYATQLAQGMNYLHNCKPPVLHRDLKPANLLVDHSGVLKISDFGLAKVRPNPNTKEVDTFRMTGETGSYRFMAPEVFRHENYNETVDIYSYAMILFYLLDGKPPWPLMNGIRAVQQAAREGERPIVPRSWDARLQSLLRQAWDENPASRPSFKRILALLNDYSSKFPDSPIHNSVLLRSNVVCCMVVLV